MKTIPVIAVCVQLLIAGCSNDNTPGTNRHSGKQPGAQLVEVAIVRVDSLSQTETRTGTLRALRRVRIFNQEEGRITALPFFPGDSVEQGQLVAQTDAALIEAELTKAALERRQADSDLQRLTGLPGKLVSDNDLAQARTRLQLARAEEQLLTIRLGYTRITAPFNGIVTERLHEPGDVVTRHSHLLTISDPASLITSLSVSELLLPAIQQGMPVEVRIDALGDRVFAARVSRLYPDIDPRTGQGTIEITLDAIPEGARAGQYCRVTIRSPASPRLVVPFAATQHDNDGEFVYRIDDTDKARRVAIRSGLRLGTRVEVLDGLMAGDRVVTRGFLGLRDGKQTRVVTTTDARAATRTDGR